MYCLSTFIIFPISDFHSVVSWNIREKWEIFELFNIFNLSQMENSIYRWTCSIPCIIPAKSHRRITILWNAFRARDLDLGLGKSLVTREHPDEHTSEKVYSHVCFLKCLRSGTTYTYSISSRYNSMSLIYRLPRTMG